MWVGERQGEMQALVKNNIRIFFITSLKSRMSSRIAPTDSERALNMDCTRFGKSSCCSCYSNAQLQELIPSLLPLLVVCCRAGMCVKPIHCSWPTNLSSHLDVVGRARDVVVAPLDEDDVLAPLPHHVVHRVPPAALVLDHHLKQHFMVSVTEKLKSGPQVARITLRYWVAHLLVGRDLSKILN